MIDIGVNFHSKPLAGRAHALITEAQHAGISAILATGTSLAASRHALTLATDWPNYVFATAGIHPHDASTWGTVEAELRTLWADARVVAVGECGLDYNRMFSPRDAQLDAFGAQLDAAVTLNKPLFLHNRDAFADFRAMTRTAGKAGARGVVHCFTGTKEEVRAHLDDGFEIGITGWIADDRRNADLREALRFIPLDRLHLETDAPYLTPRNMPATPRTNAPVNLIWVARAIATLLQRPLDHITAQCAANSRRLFLRPL